MFFTHFIKYIFIIHTYCHSHHMVVKLFVSIIGIIWTFNCLRKNCVSRDHLLKLLFYYNKYNDIYMILGVEEGKRGKRKFEVFIYNKKKLTREFYLFCTSNVCLTNWIIKI